jgi:flagellar motility protein MotE (MotC chaperone)
MSRRKQFKFRTFIIGLALVKLVVVALCLSGILPFTDLLFTRDTAVAQDEVAEAKAAEAVDASAEDEETNQNQYAEIQAMMNQIEARRMQLAEEENRIKNERDQLEQLKLDIDIKLDEMKAVQAKIEEGLARKAQLAAQEQQQKSVAEAAKLKQLVKVYSSMSPKKAAGIIDKLDMKVIYEVFSNMKGEEIGQILSYVSGERAAKITERLAANNDK